MCIINKIEIKNFKSIFSAELIFKPLTFLTGLNSSGKSSVIQFLNMASKLNLDENISSYGSYEDLRCRYSETGQDIGGNIYFENALSRNGFAMPFLSVYTKDNKVHSKATEILEWNQSFISANRFGPQVTLNAPDDSVQSVGERGENVIPFCIKKQEEGMLFTNDPRLHGRADADTFDLNLDAWMGEICPGLKIHATWEKDIDTSYYKLGNKSDPTIKERPTNVGFGISYTLPVVAQLLGAISGDIVCIENPEAHLHPLGQTNLGKLIALTAASGVQVIIETHSDHLIDGMRIAVLEKLLSYEDVAVFYFSKNKQNISEYQYLQVTEDGDMSDWPQGFCDQAVINLTKLARF